MQTVKQINVITKLNSVLYLLPVHSGKMKFVLYDRHEDKQEVRMSMPGSKYQRVETELFLYKVTVCQAYVRLSCSIKHTNVRREVR